MLPWTIVRLSCSKHSLLLDYILPPLVGSWVPVAGSLAAGRLSAGSATKRTVGYQDAAWTQLPAAHGWKADMNVLLPPGDSERVDSQNEVS